ncbi:MAG: GIY-YIG nuclease family protein [Leadbetterella sp.]
MKIYYLYILKCSDGTFYTGVTSNLERRLIEHENGVNPKSYTFYRRPIDLQFFETFADINQAIEYEKKLKKWSALKKQALIDKNYEKLKEYAICRNQTHHLNYRSKDDV